MSHCVLKFTGRMDGERFVFVCENCKEEVRGKRKESPPKAKCREAAENPTAPQVHRLPPLGGTGTELSLIFAELGIKPKASCGCKAKAAAMDSWGIEGCKERRVEILEWMREAYDSASFGEWLAAGISAAWQGKPKSCAGLLDLAIERAEQKEKTIKVAFLAPSTLLGGAERWIASLCRHFDPSIVWPQYIALTEPRSRSPVVEGWLPQHTRVVSAELLPQVLEKIDVLIAWGTGDLAHRTKGAKCRIIEVQHGTMGFGDYQRRLAVSGIEAGAVLTAVGEACLDNFPEEYRSQVTVIQNGAETDRLQPIIGREAKRKELGILSGEKVCLFIGRISKVKNLDGLAAAMDLLPGWRLVVAGPEYQKHHCLGNAIVLPSQEHLGDLLAAADVFAAPSHHEANSLAVIEAWLAGVPTVTTDYPAALAMQAKHGKMSWLVPINPSPRVLADAIEEAGKWRGTLPVENVRAIALKNYTAKAMAERWQAFVLALQETPISSRQVQTV